MAYQQKQGKEWKIYDHYYGDCYGVFNLLCTLIFRPQPKFWRMPIVIIRRICPLSLRPSVRLSATFSTYNLFCVIGMHNKLHIQVNHD